MEFFDDNALLGNDTAVKLYGTVKDLAIIDFHCHLDEAQIARDDGFENIGKLWLSHDHYKWRAMRLCGVDEIYITGNASWYEKFINYAAVMPKLIGNPLYYWTHFELKQLFGINIPLNAENADRIWNEANAVLRPLTVRDILKRFKAEYIATTDDPASRLEYHGKYEDTVVAPTFRADRLFALDEESIKELGNPCTLEELKATLKERLEFFISKGCRIADCGFDEIPGYVCSDKEAEDIYIKRDKTRKQAFFAHILAYLCKLYREKDIVLQLHFGTYRNVNTKMFGICGRDSGFDIERGYIDTDSLAVYLDYLNTNDSLPVVVLYPLNAYCLESVCTLSGAFGNVYIGAAWWFNDTVEGIKRYLSVTSEYSALGIQPGMVTDSRSFSSYARFDFFRRILASFVAEKVDKGEYDMSSAEALMKDICYNNAKKLIIQRRNDG
ncbi:MAG: glucuronate isomerase [Eubacteriales bacterium]|nr:glucuronate isomerase [Eubacteriales bacterium]